MTEVLGIKGYGVSFDQISKFIDRAKLVDYVFEGIENDAEVLGLSNDQLLFEALEMNGIVDFVYAESVTGYVLIQEKLPWNMYHNDYKELYSETRAKEYIWEKLNPFFYETVKEEDLYIMLDYIDDTYCS